MQGVAKICDFGTAFSAHGHLVKEEITTAYCQAPEVTLGETRQTMAIDMWAVGVAAFCLRFGCCPWFENTSDKDEALWVQVQIVGPITRKSWPNHHELLRWPAWRDKYGGFNDELRNSGEQPFWAQAKKQMPDYKGTEPGADEVNFICGLLQWTQATA